MITKKELRSKMSYGRVTASVIPFITCVKHIVSFEDIETWSCDSYENAVERLHKRVLAARAARKLMGL